MIEVCCAIIFSGECVLAVQRGGESHHPYQWEFPGGKVEPGENYAECIVREIREELQVEIQPLAKLQAVEHNYPEKSIRLIPFVCQLVHGTITLTEHNHSIWISRNGLDQLNWQEADRRLLEINKSELLKRMMRKDDHDC
ncbi:(deoxy)nucleoside triphosphate pyrophosphohydrolase [Gaoshiqia sediminis]|uniref:8-oxo-dGTP diphosphatase n=1 Tax=Gaoshiqia sediminis TaxID=2986998 RepID=A0AA42CAY1_9BACT|nr:(deoxy)nucleoside triphosphate pyrophosphohydrolase [Gaoshiqia sediminis]MCW0484175.1 (deoxy)nucleoside triphosphate pyrophosphohydrolase [Gaoshiqia sediminis]